MGAGDLCLSVSKTTLPPPSRTATKPCIQLSSSGTATLWKFKLKPTRCIGIPNTVLLLTFHTKKINTIEMSWLWFIPSYQNPKNTNIPKWISELATYEEPSKNHRLFRERLISDFFNHRIFVFSPKGDVE